jgi:hypothetical protein
MLKKGAAPTNWGDEREDINRDDEENENHEWHDSKKLGHFIFI